MADPRSDFLADHKEDELYALDPVTVFNVASTLIQLLLTFLPADKAKALLDHQAIIRANAVADAAVKGAGLDP